MSQKEREAWRRDLEAVEGIEEIPLSDREKEAVTHILNNNLSDEERKRGVVSKAVGDYYYTFRNRGFNSYEFIDRQPID